MNSKALDHFLVATERRAFRIAMIGVKNEETALDIVQLAMMRLAENTVTTIQRSGQCYFSGFCKMRSSTTTAG